MISYWIFATPLGDAGMVTGEKGIKYLVLPGWDKAEIEEYILDLFPQAQAGANPTKDVLAAMDYVKNYFYGAAPKILVKLDLSELGEFQRKVLEVVSKIPRGQTRSYAWVAEQLKNQKAIRAVAQALAHNPLPLFIPCHRVLGKDGSLKGFSSPQGIRMKKYLLHLEEKPENKMAG